MVRKSAPSPPPPPPWRSRIVGYSDEPPDQLLASPFNWRIHPKAQQEALQGVLHEVGLVQNIVVNRRTQHVVDGHLRIALAMREGQPTVSVTWVDLDEAEERLVLATLDPIAAQAVADKALFASLLQEVTTGEPALQALLGELAQQTGVVPGDTSTPSEPVEVIGFVPSGAKRENNNLQQISQGGGIYVGLYCGDIMVMIPCALYERWWAYVDDVRHASRAQGVMQVLEEGLHRCASAS